MSKKEKLLERLKSKPKDFSYDELRVLLMGLGFVEDNRGKTSGSAVSFANININERIKLHKPHPRNILKVYQVEYILEELKRIGVI